MSGSKILHFYRVLFIAIQPFLFFSLELQAKNIVNIYTYRQPELIQPVLDAFTKETGIKTKVLFLDKGLEERILAEGHNSPADIIMTVDISRLTGAKKKGITQTLTDDLLIKNIPEQYRDPEGHWFGLTRRARVIYASKKINKTHMTYAELSDPQWKGKICMRSGQHDYNIALFSAALAHWKQEKTEKWMKGLKSNLAHKPQGGDRLQAKAVAVGECDIALGNTYYIGLMRNAPKDPSEQKLAQDINLIFPTFENGGTHVNISGVALARYAPNRENAIKLMRFLSGEKAQVIYAEKNFEYPVIPNVDPSPKVKEFGILNPDSISLVEVSEYRKQASEMVDRVQFDN